MSNENFNKDETIRKPMSWYGADIPYEEESWIFNPSVYQTFDGLTTDTPITKTNPVVQDKPMDGMTRFNIWWGENKPFGVAVMVFGALYMFSQ